MKFIPHDYQKYTINEIIKRKTIWLNLDMGLGKTICTLEAINYWLNTLAVKKVLIVAPIRVCVHTWCEELAKFSELSHITHSLIVGDKNKRIKALHTPADIYIINQENIVWLVEYLKSNHLPLDYDCVVIDESSNFKNYSSKRFKYIKLITSKVSYKVLLTGTPMPNGYMDLWAQCYLLDSGERLGKFITHYRAMYFYPSKKNSQGVVFEWSLKSGSEDLIKNKIKDLTISFDNKQIKLPERIDTKEYVVLTENLLNKYRALKRNYLLELDTDTLTAQSAGVLTSKLLQFASGSVYNELGNPILIHTEKIKALQKIIDLHNFDNILIFYNFNHEKETIIKNIQNVRLFETKQDKTDWDKGKIKLLLAHPKSMGHGLNMQQGGSVVVWYSLTYDLALFEQANARLYRQGQTKRTFFYYLLAKDTIDEQVYKRLTQKGYTQEMYLKELMSSKN